jgi:hypothetical protein
MDKGFESFGMDARRTRRGSRMPTLGKLIAQPMADDPAPLLTMQQKIDRWMINEGGRRMYAVLHDGDEDGMLMVDLLLCLFCFISWSMHLAS